MKLSKKDTVVHYEELRRNLNSPIKLNREFGIQMLECTFLNLPFLKCFIERSQKRKCRNLFKAMLVTVILTYIDNFIICFCVQVISNELIRNLGLTMAAVVSVTLILISDLVTVFWVFTCIAFTLIDLLGLMYYWGLTVEISSSIIVILAAGLAIDYSAHIGHTFTTVHGSKSSNKLSHFSSPA